MAFTLAGYTESQDTAGVLTQVAAIPDQHITTQGDDIKVPTWASRLMGVMAIGATITQAQISSPSLRESSLLDVNPLNVGAEPTMPEAFVDLTGRPRILTPAEGLRALVAEAAALAELETVLVWLLDKIDPLPDGEIETIRATSATALVANTWSLCTLTLSQQLRAGKYAIVGMKAISATCLAARLVIPGSAYRPGCPGTDAEADDNGWQFRNGSLGSWGEFEHSFVPQVEFLATAADAAETVYLDVIKVG